MKVLVGCPVHKRQWVLPSWFEAVESSFEDQDVDLEYVFAFDPNDTTLHACLSAYTDMANRSLHVAPVQDQALVEIRRWERPERIQHMVEVRNALLGEVRTISPDLFFSVDSDILIKAPVVQDLLETVQDYDAVGGKVYLSKAGIRCPSYGSMIFNRMVRGADIPYVKPNVGVIMALKMMKPSAYSIDYQFHATGEDIGWSLAAGQAGLKFAFDGRHPAKHVWSEDHLDTYDKRVGY